MTSTQQIKQSVRRRQLRTRLLLGTVGFLVVLLVVSLVLGVGGSGEPESSPSAPPGQSGQVAPQGQVTLPGAGEIVQEKFPAKFPRSAEGAAATMAAMLSSSWTMDAAHNRQAALVYAQPQARQKAVQASIPTAEGTRKKVGLPANGPLPAEAYARVTPLGVRWKVISPDRVRVAMMVEYTAAASAQSNQVSQVVAQGSDWVWDPTVRGGDWVWTLEDVSAFVPEIAEVGTQKFTSAGWLAVRP